MREEIALPIEKYGLFKQRSMLHNCTQLPTVSGNAEVQIAPIPMAEDKHGKDWVPEGCAIKQAEECFGWLIYRLEHENGEQEITLRKKAGGFNCEPFDRYAASKSNGWGHFTSAEFVDKDALKWVVLQFSNEAWIFSEGLSQKPSLNKTGDIEAFKPESEIFSLFIEGTYFQSYKFFKNQFGRFDWNISVTGFFSDSGSGWLSFVKSMIQGLENFKTDGVTSDGVILDKGKQEWFTSEEKSGDLIEEYFKVTLPDFWNSGFVERNRFSYYKYFRIFSQLLLTGEEGYGFAPPRFNLLEDQQGVYLHPNVVEGDSSADAGQMQFLAEKIWEKIEFIKGSMEAQTGNEAKIEESDWNEFRGLFNDYVEICGRNSGRAVLWYADASLRQGGFIYTPMSTGVNHSNGISFGDLKGSFIQGGKIEKCLSFYQDDTTDGLVDFEYEVEWDFANLPNLVDRIENSKSVSQNTLNTYNMFYLSWEANRENMVNDIESKMKLVEDLIDEIRNDPRFLEDGELNSDAKKAIKTLDDARTNLRHMKSQLEKESEGYIRSIFTEPKTYENLEVFRRKLDSVIKELKALEGYLNWFADESKFNPPLDFFLANRSDLSIKWIEQMSHMLIAVASDNRMFYSNPGTPTFEALNFYSAEYANSMILQCWRLANRLVVITSNTVEFWDITNDFEDPLSPAYSSNVYSLQALANSIVRYNDTLWFIARPVEMDSYGVFSLDKNGQLANISYPQLETWINGLLPAGSPDYDKNVTGSAICLENVPLVMWHLKDELIGGVKHPVENLVYNIIFNSFCWNDSLFFLVDGNYWQFDGNAIGSLGRYHDGEGHSVPCKIVTANSNFDGKRRNVMALEVDVDLEEGKRDPRENIIEPLEPLGEKRERFMVFNFSRVSKMPWASMRKVLLKPAQGSRNVCFKVFGIGLAADFQTEVKWNGHLRLNRLKLEIE